MKKSVLIIDTPDNCKECRISKCALWVDGDERPQDCPLRPLPPKEPCNYYDFETFTSGVAHGHNRLLDQIGYPAES